MSKDQITQTTLDDKLPATLRERLERDKFRPNKTPSWDYIDANTRWSAQGLHNKCKKIHGKSLHEHLRDQGFGTNSTNYHPTSHEPTLKSVTYFLNSLEKRAGWSENTIDSVRSAIKKAIAIIEKLGIEKELLTLGQINGESEDVENKQNMISIIDEMNKELAESTMSNYTHYIEEYYYTIDNAYSIDHNPASEALREYTFQRKYSNPKPVTEEELRRLWTTLNALTTSPYARYQLEDWKLWMKIIIVFMIGVGPRACEFKKVDIRTDIHFGEDPHVIFHVRKNLQSNVGPVEVPIMFGADFLNMTLEYIDHTFGNGALIPSAQSETGCRTGSTINNWIQRLCELSNMDFDRIPTVQNFRQMWKNEYRKALHQNRKYIKFISNEDSKKDYSSDEEAYITNENNRRMVRELGRKYFDNLINITTVPDPIQQTLDPDCQFGKTTDITNY